eukprot:CAMPEP_0197649804 /NCGR_PEP_ID=MMETSP1338-20131121/29807_1 /TAXON_ID=43686 ORGANISM="Pelagodinium beii, Strain RCC1491" /NCGR_SAMPLE_ID=MMETSP1338 /ASSEMBLY_ACC=CAM_ASM_000754 /LENGTH=235 /DNA_ID=CAMNT_0043224079 /DNA_START=347 /DNA_END=1056 /DNA_ORIENTATION=+
MPASSTPAIDAAVFQLLAKGNLCSLCQLCIPANCNSLSSRQQDHTDRPAACVAHQSHGDRVVLVRLDKFHNLVKARFHTLLTIDSYDPISLENPHARIFFRGADLLIEYVCIATRHYFTDANSSVEGVAFALWDWLQLDAWGFLTVTSKIARSPLIRLTFLYHWLLVSRMVTELASRRRAATTAANVPIASSDPGGPLLHGSQNLELSSVSLEVPDDDQANELAHLLGSSSKSSA